MNNEEIDSILERMVEIFIMLNLHGMALGVKVLKDTIRSMDSDAYNYAERVSELEQEVMSLETSELDLERQVMDLETEVSDLEEIVFDLEQDIVGLEAEVSDAK
jgi:exonuclease VII small subunit